MWSALSEVQWPLNTDSIYQVKKGSKHIRSEITSSDVNNVEKLTCLLPKSYTLLTLRLHGPPIASRSALRFPSSRTFTFSQQGSDWWAGPPKDRFWLYQSIPEIMQETLAPPSRAGYLNVYVVWGSPSWSVLTYSPQKRHFCKPSWGRKTSVRKKKRGGRAWLSVKQKSMSISGVERGWPDREVVDNQEQSIRMTVTLSQFNRGAKRNNLHRTKLLGFP